MKTRLAAVSLALCLLLSAVPAPARAAVKTTYTPDGSTLTVDTGSNGTVTTTETRKDRVVIRTVEVPGQSVTARITLPYNVSSASVVIPCSAGWGTVAADTKTGRVLIQSHSTDGGLRVRVTSSCELTLTSAAKTFSDMDSHYAKNAADFVSARGLYTGTSERFFDPDVPMTRAMLMTVLARMDGVDTSGGSIWYEKGLTWAMQMGISDGTGPTKPITRQQMVTMLYRFAGSPDPGDSLTSFTDFYEVDLYARDAVSWAAATGLVVGMGGARFQPKGEATRAQVATLIARYCRMMTDADLPLRSVGS